MGNILVLPGWMRKLKFYNPQPVRVIFGAPGKGELSADNIAGLSLGALEVLEKSDSISGKIILLNPPLPKRGLLVWFWRWLKFIRRQGLFRERQKFTANPFRWLIEILNCVRLLCVDFSDRLDRRSDKITVIRNRGDEFFCDVETEFFLRRKNIKVIEVAGGHNWSEDMEVALQHLISGTSAE